MTDAALDQALDVGFDDFDLPEEVLTAAIQKKQSAKQRKKEKEDGPPDDLHVFGFNSAAWQLLECYDVPLTSDAILQALVLRRKFAFGLHDKITPEEIKICREIITTPHVQGNGESLVKFQLRDDSPEVRWGWTVLCAWIEHRRAQIAGEDIERFRYQGIINRGASSAKAPEDIKYVDGSPPAEKLKLWGEEAPLYAIWRSKPPTSDADSISRISIVKQAIVYQNTDLLKMDDVKYFIKLFEMSSEERGFTFPNLGISDDLWSFLGTKRMLDQMLPEKRKNQQLQSAKPEKAAKRASRKKDKPASVRDNGTKATAAT